MLTGDGETELVGELLEEAAQESGLASATGATDHHGSELRDL